MRALILRPKIEVPFEALMPGEIGEKWVCFPALGALYVRQAAIDGGFDCDYLDAEALDLPVAGAAAIAAKENYQVVALPADTYSLISTINQARAIKKALPKTLVVCGGIHPTIYPEETALLPCFDAVVFGDGETPFSELLKGINNGSFPSKIPGIIAKEKEQLIKGDTPIFEKNLDSLGYPDYSGIKLDHYYSSLAKARPVLPLVTSRGCPFKCTFCDRPVLANRVRYRTAGHVIDEMKHLISMGVREFSIYDDTFTANKKRAHKILDAMAGLPQKVGFDIRSRVDTSNEEILDALNKAGCDRVYIGVESGDPIVQKTIQKNLDLEKAREVFKQVQKRGMKALAYFMIGLPGETEKQANNTIEYARNLWADYYLFEVFTPMPATEAYEQGIKRGILPGDYWKDFASAPTLDFSPPLWEEHMKGPKLAQLIREAYKKTYLSPGYIWRSLLKTSTWEEFKQKVKGGLSFLRLYK